MSFARALVLEAPRRLVARELAAARDRRRRRAAARRGVRALRHRPRAVHRRAVPRLRVRARPRVGRRDRADRRRAAAARWGVRDGDRVAVEVFLSCRECAACRAGEYRRCARHGLADMYGYVPRRPRAGAVGRLRAVPVPRARLDAVPASPTSLDPVTATLFNPLGAGIRWGVTLPGTRAGDVVAVLGPGVRGLSACAAAKHAGAGFVMVTGRGARDAPRLALASRVRRRPRGRRRRRRSGARACGTRPAALADVVVDVTAKAPAAFVQARAARAARRHGRGRRDAWRRRTSPGLRSRSDRLQGAARARRAGRRHRRVHRRDRAARRRAASRSTSCPAGSSGSTRSARCLPSWPAKARCRPCTRWSCPTRKASSMTQPEFPQYSEKVAAGLRGIGGGRGRARRRSSASSTSRSGRACCTRGSPCATTSSPRSATCTAACSRRCAITCSAPCCTR